LPSVKRTASILLLAILLFNWLGYQFLSSYFEDKANTRLEAQLDDNNYDESQLISIKIPAEHLAYYNNSKQFDRVDGKIEISGIQYNYVKKRLYNDSLEFLCIPNHEVMRLQTAKDDFFKLVNDLQHTGQGKKSDSHSNSKNLVTDYYMDNNAFNLNVFYFSTEKRPLANSSSITSRFSLTAEQPPEIC
jgi:hypothetical protein